MTSDALRTAGTRVVTAACVTMAIGVGLGAFGAHGLAGRLSPDLFAIYDTAVQYHLVHGLAALAAGLLAQGGGRRAHVAGWMFLAGVAVFSGSLYVLAVTGVRWLGAVTPIGGVLWIVAWLLLATSHRTRV